MGIRYYDSRDNWKERGYKIEPGSLPVSVDLRTKEDLYSWGQVVPLDYKPRKYKTDEHQSNNP